MMNEKPLVPQGPQLIAPVSYRLVYASLALAYLGRRGEAIREPWRA